MREHIRARFLITTPMFLGGAQQQMAELRPPSIRGALRFWWRASQWAKCSRDAKGDPVEALRDIHTREASLFGAARSGEVGGQGVLIRARLLGKGKAKKPESKIRGQQYMLGQGLYKHGEGCPRCAIPPETQFEVRLIPRAGEQQARCGELAWALWLWGTLGGLGSRSRRGLGSVALQELEGSDLSVPNTVRELKDELGNKLIKLPQSLPPLSAFSSESRIDASLEEEQGEDGWRMLGRLGEEMWQHRSWHGEQKFQGDHDSMRAVTNGTPAKVLPERIVFGLPHNYFFSSSEKKVDILPETKERARRGSPLFLHIHRFPGGQLAAIQTLLPATFLPMGDRVAVAVKRQAHSLLSANPDWSVLHDYLDRFSPRKGLHP